MFTVGRLAAALADGLPLCVPGYPGDPRYHPKSLTFQILSLAALGAPIRGEYPPPQDLQHVPSPWAVSGKVLVTAYTPADLTCTPAALPEPVRARLLAPVTPAARLGYPAMVECFYLQLDPPPPGRLTLVTQLL